MKLQLTSKPRQNRHYTGWCFPFHPNILQICSFSNALVKALLGYKLVDPVHQRRKTKDVRWKKLNLGQSCSLLTSLAMLVWQPFWWVKLIDISYLPSQLSYSLLGAFLFRHLEAERVGAVKALVTNKRKETLEQMWNTTGL